MDTLQLRNALRPLDGTLTLSSTLLPANLASLWERCYPSALVITDAAPGPGDGTDDTVVITGRSSVLGIPDLPTTARFSLDASGQPRVLILHQLRDDAPGPTAWTFSRSFPKLPISWNYTTRLADEVDTQAVLAQQRPLLDSLELFGSFYAVSSHALTEPVLGVALEPGLNFVSRLRPTGMLGVLQATAGTTGPLTLHGPIHLPLPTDRTLPLTRLQRVWDRPDAPGIHLQAPLPLDFTLGALSFRQGTFRVYTPLSTDWLAQNRSFQPRHGYTGRLSIPSAGLEVETSIDLLWNSPSALLHAKCEGVTLARLGQLVDLTGSDTLSSLLPEELGKAMDTLGRLELTALQAHLGLVQATPTLQQLRVTLGLPGLVWKVWDEHLKIEGLSCRFDISRPFSASRSTSILLMGTVRIEGVPVTVCAESDDGFTLFALLEGAQTVPLASLMKTYAPGIPPPSDLTVNTLALTLAPGRTLSMSTTLADAPKPWVIPLGKSNVSLREVLFDFTTTRGSPTTGAFSGTAVFGKTLSLAVGYSVPGSLTLRGVFPRVNLTQLVAELCDELVPLPAGFDLVLENASVLIQKQNDTYTFRAATGVKDFGLLAFEVRKVPGKGWGFATGMSLGTAGLSQLPGLGGLKSIEDSFKLQKLMLVLSSFEDAGFTLPDLAQFNQPALGTQQVKLPAQASGVIPGLMLFAEWQLDANSREQRLLKSLLGLGDTQSATVALGANPMKDFRLFVSQRGTIQKQPFQYRFGVQLDNGKPSFFLTGTLTAKIQGQTQTFDLTTAFVPGGAFLSATMKGGSAVDCGPFKLSNLALQMGVNWGGVPSLGIAATLDVKKFQSSLAVFFDSTDPSRSLVAGSLGTLTAKDVMDTLVGGNLSTPFDEVLTTTALKGTQEFSLPATLADALDGLVLEQVSAAFAQARVPLPSSTQQLTVVSKQKGAAWHLTDLTTMRHYELEKKDGAIRVRVAPQFYFAPQPTFIGTLQFPQSYYLNAALSVAGFEASATVDISQNKGFRVDTRMDRIVFVDERLFAFSDNGGKAGPRLSISTFTQPNHELPEFRPPHFYLSGDLTLLGLRRALHASVTRDGVEFELRGPLVPGVYFELEACLGKSGLEAGGSARVGLGTLDLGALGKAKLDFQLEADVDLSIDASRVELWLEADFEFAGQGFQIPRFKLDAAPDTFTKLPEVLTRKAETALRDAFKDSARWVDALGKGALEEVKDAEKVLRGVYGKSEKEAKALAKSASKTASQAGKAVTGAAKSVTKSVSKGGKKLLKKLKL